MLNETVTMRKEFNYNRPSVEDIERITAERALRDKLLTPEKFLVLVENYAEEYDYSILEAVVHYCQENDIDIELVATKLMSNKLYNLIEEDAEEKNLIDMEIQNRIQFA